MEPVTGRFSMVEGRSALSQELLCMVPRAGIGGDCGRQLAEARWIKE